MPFFSPTARVVGASWLVLLVILVSSAAVQPKPPWQRLLQGEEAKKAAELEKRLDQLQGAGSLAEAVKVAQSLLELRSKVQGEDHWQTANARWWVETLRRVLRQEPEGRQVYARSLLLHRQAKALVDEGRFREARPLIEEVLSVWQKVLGAEHPLTAKAYGDLAYNLNTRGKYAEAEANSRKALAINLKTLGEQHPETASSYEDVANDQSDQGKYLETEAGHRKALAIRLQVLGEEHSQTAKSYNNIATNLSRRGKHAEAQAAIRKALDLMRQVLGEEHFETAIGYGNLAATFFAQGRYAEAEVAARKSLEIRRKVLGENHPFTAQEYHNLATNLDFLGKFAETESIHRKALDILRNTVGEENADTAHSYGQLASNLHSQGKYAESEVNHRHSLAIYLKLLGKEHPDVARSYHNLAVLMNSQGKIAEAEASYRTALDICRKALGEEHLETAACYASVASCLYGQGKYTEAEEYWTNAAHSFAKARIRLAASGLERAAQTSERSPLPILAAVLARNGKPEAAWQRFEESLARGTWDDLSARLRRSPDEQAKQTVFVERLNRLDQIIQSTFTAKETTTAQRKRREELLRQRRQLQDAFDTFSAELEKTYGPAAGQVFDRLPIQKTLPPDTALVGWLDFTAKPQAADPNGEHWAILLRSAGPPHWVRLPGTGPKDAWTQDDTLLPKQLRNALQSPSGDWQPLAQRLRRQRLQPLVPYLAAADGLPAVRHLIVLPATMLSGLPVDTFADGYTVSYALSSTLYAHLRQRPRPESKGLFAVADPVFEASAVAHKPQLLPPGGVLVTMVAPGSNAARAGLRPNDVLLRYGATELTGPADFKPLAPSAGPEQRVPVVVWREGKKLAEPLFVRPGKLGVVLASKPAPQALAEQRRLDLQLASRGDDDWARLPGTRYEAVSIQRLFSSAPTQLLIDSDASEQRLSALASEGVLGKYRHVHLATHGQVDDVFPLRSAVILSRDKLPDERQRQEQLLAGQPIADGRLTAQEVLQGWNLHCELVTLSACQTALGKYERGEGHVGFAQALILAGSRSVCLSLWKVNDTATALLMERFYQNLLGQRANLKAPLPKAAALAEAKDWLRKLSRAEILKGTASLSKGVERGPRPKLPPLEVPRVQQSPAEADHPYAHPYFWAAFVLIGDPQ